MLGRLLGAAILANALLAAPALFAFGDNSSSKGKGSKEEQALQMVQEALRLEAAGAPANERDAALRRALSYDKKSPAALSQLGNIYKDGQWLSIESLADQDVPKTFAAYEKMRAKTPDTEAGNLQLASWCQSRSLFPQQYAHLRRVLAINLQNTTARTALGWKQTANGWVSPEQFQADLRYAMEEKTSLERYGRKLASILKNLTSRREESIENAKRELREIGDPAAVAAIEKILSAHSEALAKLAIETISEIRHPAATRSLARHAIFHPTETIRNLASTALLKRDPQGWAPGMIDLLRNEIGLQIMPEFGAGGTLLGMRNVFTQEGRDSNNVFVSDTAYQRQVAAILVDATRTQFVQDDRPTTSGRFTRIDSATNASLTFSAVDNYNEMLLQNDRINRAALTSAATTKYSAELANRRSKSINERVYKSLDKLEGKKIGQEPRQYWSWWNSRKYWPTLPKKQNVYTYNQSVVSDVRPAYAAYSRSDSYRIYNVDRSSSCLTESTLVWLQNGPKPIKDVKIGDMALCKDISTGELKLAPVVRTTRSDAPTEIISFCTGDETIECTKGHEFFVSGKGWTMACDLKVGDQLHGATSPQMVQAICQPPDAVVYNLVVANLSNYFVGQDKILSHDFSERAENYYLAPGLAPAEDVVRP